MSAWNLRARSVLMKATVALAVMAAPGTMAFARGHDGGGHGGHGGGHHGGGHSSHSGHSFHGGHHAYGGTHRVYRYNSYGGYGYSTSGYWYNPWYLGNSWYTTGYYPYYQTVPSNYAYPYGSGYVYSQRASLYPVVAPRVSYPRVYGHRWCR
jgi:hypothetical protein